MAFLLKAIIVFFFNIFINNLPRVIDFTILSTYADDTQIFYAEDKVTDVE